MKKLNTSILKGGLFTAVFATLLTISSCSNNADTKDTKEVAEENNDAKFSASKEDDAEFLVDAAEINLEEIQLGQLAQNNSNMPDVKDLGKMMERDHTIALKELEILAAKKQITIPTLPTNDSKDAYDKLKNKFAGDFDKDYCDMMVKGHVDAINKFEKVANDTKDADIKSWAESMLVSLRSHSDHAMSCQEKCSKMKSKS